MSLSSKMKIAYRIWTTIEAPSELLSVHEVLTIANLPHLQVVMEEPIIKVREEEYEVGNFGGKE